MSLKETLLQDMKEAMKNKDTVRKNTVQLIRAGVLQIEKDKQIELDDEGVLDVIAKELKKRRDSLPDFEKIGRADLIENLNKEIEVLFENETEGHTTNYIKVVRKGSGEAKLETVSPYKYENGVLYS